MDFAKLNDSISVVISIEDVFPLPCLRMRPSRTRNRDWLPLMSRVSSRGMRLHRFQRLKVSISPNRTHCASLSVDFLGYILLLRKHYSLFVRKKTSVESVLLPLPILPIMTESMHPTTLRLCTSYPFYAYRRL